VSVLFKVPFIYFCNEKWFFSTSLRTVTFTEMCMVHVMSFLKTQLPINVGVRLDSAMIDTKAQRSVTAVF
jgi:hypothetical protein